jgi:hypothetical protein
MDPSQAKIHLTLAHGGEVALGTTKNTKSTNAPHLITIIRGLVPRTHAHWRSKVFMGGRDEARP